MTLLRTWMIVFAAIQAAQCESPRAQSALPLERITPAAGLRDRDRRARAQCPCDDVGRQRHAVRRLDGRGQGVRGDAAGAGRERRSQASRSIASGLREPAGVAFRDGALYVSAIDRILRFDDIERRLADPPPPVVVTDRFPSDRHHGRKFIAFGPDGKLYVHVGAPCNVCELDPDSLREHHADESRRHAASRSFARGVRNSVGFDWDPRTQELWFTDNGRDMLGDDIAARHAEPRAARRACDFGFPYCHAGTIPDPEFGQQACVQRVRARPRRSSGRTSRRSACASTRERSFPPRYRNQIFIAEHGSWNRSQQDRLSRHAGDARRTPASAIGYEPFAEGWLQGERAWGRPADVLVAPDGSLLVSDDAAGAIYRIRYRGSP